MTNPTFWFSNSGLTLEIILNKVCCFKKKITVDYEWDLDNETSYKVENAQPIYYNSISNIGN